MCRGDGAGFVWDSVSVTWSGVCLCARAYLRAPWGWATPGIMCPWVSSHAKPDCSNTKADQVQPVLPTLEG